MSATDKLSHYIYRTPHGLISIEANDYALTRVALDRQSWASPLRPNELTNRCATELMEYFAGKRSFFDLPMAPQGSDFQQRIWKLLELIPYGQTKTSLEIALESGSEESYRSVGVAVRKNPLLILIPSHRVVNDKGVVNGHDLLAQQLNALRIFEQTHL